MYSFTSWKIVVDAILTTDHACSCMTAVLSMIGLMDTRLSCTDGCVWSVVGLCGFSGFHCAGHVWMSSARASLRCPDSL